jgi:hypothetical protein
VTAAFDPKDPTTWPPAWQEQIRKEEAERITTLSWQTLKRRYPHLIRKASPRRNTMLRGHALMLGGQL